LVSFALRASQTCSWRWWAGSQRSEVRGSPRRIRPLVDQRSEVRTQSEWGERRPSQDATARRALG